MGAKDHDIVVVSKLDDDSETWSKANKLKSGNWFVVDRENGFKVSSDTLLGPN